MNKFIFILLCLMYNLKIAMASVDINGISVYREAFEYVMSDMKTQKIFVSPYFEYIDCWDVLDSLDDAPCKKHIIKDILERSKFGCFSYEEEGKYSQELALLKTPIKKPSYILFFSKYNDGICFASLVPVPFYIKKIKKNHIYRHIDVARFNVSVNYLFIYDPDKKIRKVFKIHVQYD